MFVHTTNKKIKKLKNKNQFNKSPKPIGIWYAKNDIWKNKFELIEDNKFIILWSDLFDIDSGCVKYICIERNEIVCTII